MGAKVRGIKLAHAKLNALIDDVKGKKAVRAIQSALIIGGSQAAIYTPIDTSTLINSQFRELNVSGTKLTGRVGYSANYAIYVHDPNVHQTFRRASAKKEFLNKGFEDTRRLVDDTIKKEMSL